MRTRRVLLLMSAALGAQTPGDILGRLGVGRKSSNRVADGLKEALRVGAGNAVNLTGRVDGFLANEAIKILLPPPMRKVERALRLAGMGPKLDELVVGMNRAAEAAAPFAKDIFLDAIRGLTIGDAQQLLKGGDTAATDFFRERTTPQLTMLFTPPVKNVMAQVGVTQQYSQFLGQAAKNPFVKVDKLDIESYVVDRALFGLFHVLGEEERKIRRDPAARVTAILKEVFGGR